MMETVEGRIQRKPKPPRGRVRDAGARLDKAQRLAEVPCLRDLPPARLHELQGRTTESAFRKGTVLVRQGQPAEKVLVVSDGRLKICREVEGGRRHTVSILGESDCICFAPVHAVKASQVSAECLTDVRVVEIDRRDLDRLAGREPTYTRAVIDCLSDRLAGAIDWTVTASHGSVPERLASTLLDLAQRQGVETEEGMLLESITHEDLASCIGTVREVVSRTVSRFQREGLLRTGRGRLRILDMEGLARTAGWPGAS
jgi:CRP-like cAMP-binding protein